MAKNTDDLYMVRALSLARKGQGLTGVNPTVGAVLVKNGRIIGEGFHVKSRLDHAEIVALDGLSPKVTKGAVLFVTLEPCCHTDKQTPPCTARIIEAGIRKVVVGMIDPNPKVSGKGINKLRKAGISVVIRPMGLKVGGLNEFYFKSIKTSLPYMTIKHAISLDGKIAAADGSSKWISNEKSRREVHKMRKSYDAVMTTAVTVNKDNPGLTVRMIKGRDPKRIVVDWYMDTDIRSKVYRDNNVRVITGMESAVEKIDEFKSKGIEVVSYDKSNGLRPVLADLYASGIGSVLIEAGGRFAARLIKETLVDKLIYFISPLILGEEGVNAVGSLHIGSMKDAIKAHAVKVKRLDDDTMVEVLL